MSSNFFEEDVGDVFSDAIRGGSEPVYLVNPPLGTLPELVFRLHEAGDLPRIDMLAVRDDLKAAMADFIVAGHAADLVEEGTLSIRLLGTAPAASLVVSESAVVSVVVGDDSAGGLTTEDDSFVDDVRGHYETAWEDAEPYTLRTPALERVRETLVSEFGEGALADFEGILDALTVAKGEGEGLDEVTISVLVAAKNGELLYDISKWGEDIGLASKATFSRTKSKLEDADLIRTEKVPIDVGRPRLRLRLNEERFPDDDPETLAERTQELLPSPE
ncbi:MAG: transcriptional regulator TbsP [Haloarculaceae archaeon]